MGQGVQLEAHQVRDEEEQPSTSSLKSARRHREIADVGDGFDTRVRTQRALFIESSWQRREPFRAKYLPNCSRAEANPAFLERFADFVNGVVLLAQSDNFLMSIGLGGMWRATTGGGNEEFRAALAPEVMAEDGKGAWGITELSRDFGGGLLSDEEGAQGFVLSLFGGSWLQEEALAGL